MKKVLFTILMSVCALVIAAQPKMQKKNVSGVKVSLQEAIYEKPHKQMMVKEHLKPSSDVLKKKDVKRMQMNLLQNVSDKAVMDADTLLMSAMDYFSYKPMVWKVGLTKEGSKVTFGDLLALGGDNASLEGTISGSTITIALGQTMTYTYKNTPMEVVLVTLADDGSSIVSTGSVTGSINEEDGKIVFSKYLGVKPSSENTFVALYEPGATLYTRSAYPMVAEYSLPGAGFLPSIANDGRVFPLYYNIAAPAENMEFFPWLEGDILAKQYAWSMDKLNENLETIEPVQSSQILLQVNGVKEGDLYTIPTFTVTENGRKTDFQLGNYGGMPFDGFSYAGRYIQVGGGSFRGSSDEIYNLTNADLDYGWIVPSFGPGMYCFGTGTGVKEIMSRYDNPGAPFDIFGVELLTYAYNNPNNLPLTLSIIDVEETETGYKFGKVLAKSDVYSYKSLTTNMGYLQFADFVVEDGEGFETTLDSVRVERGFAITLGDLTQSGLTLSAVTEKYQRPYSTLNSLVIAEEEGKEFITMWNNYENRMIFNLMGWFASENSSYNKVVSSTNQTSVFSTPDAFNFAYTEDFTSLEVYNVNGQKVSSYALPQTGSFSIAKSELADGVYLFRMNGKTSEVLRAVK